MASPASAPRLYPGSRHEVRVRRPEFDFSDVGHFWLAENPVATQVFNGLNLVFPDGERFFIKAVRDQMARVDDPELAAQVRGFSGQEGRHAHEHERYFEVLRAQGYEIDTFLRRFRRFLELVNRFAPAPLRLAMTAGAEHFTAIFGSLTLRDEKLLPNAHPSMQKLVIWHASEEVEHKAVAYDVLQASSPSWLLRVLGFALASVSLFAWSGIGTRMLLRQDVKAGRTSGPEIQRVKNELVRGDKEVRRELFARVRDYLRRDFHPNQVDDWADAERKLSEFDLAA